MKRMLFLVFRSVRSVFRRSVGGTAPRKIVLDEMFFGLLEAASSEGRAQCQIAL